MDELEKLYNGLKQQGLYTKTLEDFKTKYSNNPENQSFLFDGLKWALQGKPYLSD